MHAEKEPDRAYAQGLLLKDKWALVTGASHGIGRALAEELARESAAVILTSDSLSQDGLDKVCMPAKLVRLHIQLLLPQHIMCYRGYLVGELCAACSSTRVTKVASPFFLRCPD